MKWNSLQSNKKRMEWIAVLLAVGIGIYAYFPSLVNRYVIADDVRICTFWMQQYQDPELFQNDLLTVMARDYEPWGFNFLYYLFSFVFDPIYFGTILTIFLLAVTSVYLYKLLRHIAGTYAGFLAVLVFLSSPLYISRMAGGFPRSFAYPLLTAFLYYLIKKKYPQTTVVLLLQCLFYPMIVLVALPTFFLSFLQIPPKPAWIDLNRTKVKYFVLAVVICGSILVSKHVLTHNPQIGTTYTKSEMEGKPEFYRNLGRSAELLPGDPILDQLQKNVGEGSLIVQLLGRAWSAIPGAPVNAANWVIFSALLLLLGFEVYKKRIVFPVELLWLGTSSIVMYKAADFFLFKLYVPTRYTRYSIPEISLIISVVVIVSLLARLKPETLKKAAQAAVIILLVFNFHLDRPQYLTDRSFNKGLYIFLKTLPKDSVIAAHPGIADDIPAFSGRKVFLNYEMSFPFFDQYWKTIKERTFEFFNAYYAENPADVYRFCDRNHIDYLVVHRLHFRPEFLNLGRFYTEPFNTFIVFLLQKRKDFVLDHIPDDRKLFVEGNIFVVSKEMFKP